MRWSCGILVLLLGCITETPRVGRPSRTLALSTQATHLADSGLWGSSAVQYMGILLCTFFLAAVPTSGGNGTHEDD